MAGSARGDCPGPPAGAPGRPYIGGQAIIEGVVMRSPRAVAMAARAPGGDIRLKSERYRPFYQSSLIFRAPGIRGAFILMDSLVLGMRALSWSAEQQQQEERDGPVGAKDRLALAGTLGLSLLLGIALFVALPHLITDGLGWLSGIPLAVEGPLFHLVDGLAKLAIFFAYLWLIRRNPEILRVFAYHGAEHKLIHAYERGLPLEIDAARSLSRFHPRCGTSFLLVVVAISILVFTAVFPLLPPIPIENRLLLNMAQVGIKIPLTFPVAALSYEVLRASSRFYHLAPFRWLAAPGLLLQRLTTEEPDDSQLEVALSALRCALALEAEQGGEAHGLEGEAFQTGAPPAGVPG